MCVKIRKLGICDYSSVWAQMRTFTDSRTADTVDEIWLLQHYPVFTQGQAGKAEHLLNPGTIPVIQTDRGGQITYHGPGQLMVYVLCDLKRLNYTIRDLVTGLEQSVIDLLANYSIRAQRRRDAPGVYIDAAKICSIGLRVRRGCSYHGLALNVDMDLQPFSYINPCGFQGLQMTQLSDHNNTTSYTEIENKLAAQLVNNFGYNVEPAT